MGTTKIPQLSLQNQKKLLGKNEEVINNNTIEKVSKKLIKNFGFQSVVTTKGSGGISVIRKNGENFHIPSKAKEVFDVSGAGDTVVSYIASGLARNEDFVNLIEFANEAAGIAVGKFGTAVVSRAETTKEILDHKVLSVEKLLTELKTLRSNKIGFTNGCFDLIHQGHIDYLKRQKSNVIF